MKSVSRWVLVLAMAVAATACSSMQEGGSAERAGEKAGRVIDDSVITTKIKSALVGDPVTKAHQINVETYKGVVQLSGFVDSAASRSRAGEVARGVEGVKDVKNSLELRSKN